jgi:hypothetical protein
MEGSLPAPQAVCRYRCTIDGGCTAARAMAAQAVPAAEMK